MLYKFQFGFRKQYSTNHAIISLVEKIRNALSSGNVIIGVFLDLKKAFDTVNHDILLKKLFAYGIRGNILKWFQSYLQNRKQYIYLNKIKSDTKSINCGVPQGSVLGPLLFILYINDLAGVSDRLFSILFADDTSVFAEGQSVDEAVNVMNIELKKITTWLSANKLTINVAKSHFMVFHRSRIKINSKQILLGDSQLDQINFTKFLGVVIDDKLSFTNHIAYIRNKISKGLGIIIKARKYLNRKILVNLYNTFVVPYLIYCVEIWGNACDSYLDPIIKLQKKIIRFITFSTYTEHTIPLFLELNILPFKKLVIQRIGLQMYKYSINNLPTAISELFDEYKILHQHNTRNKSNFRHPLGKQEYMYRNFSFNAIYTWNFIISKTDINTFSSYATFKYKLKTYLINNEVTFRLI